MSFRERWEGSYFPKLVEHELELLRQTDLTLWRRLRRISTGRDQIRMLGELNRQLQDFFAECYLQLKDYVPGLPATFEESRVENERLCTYIGRALVNYFDHHPDPLTSLTPEPIIDDDPARLATEILLKLGIGVQPGRAKPPGE